MRKSCLQRTLWIATMGVATVVCAHAGSLAKREFFILGSELPPASFTTPRISLYPGKPGFSGSGNVKDIATPVDQVFPGPIVDYAFFKESPVASNTADSYLVGSKGLIRLKGYTINGERLTNHNNWNIWVVTDPGADWSSIPDYSRATSVGIFSNMWGSVSLDELTSGTIYFFYYSYRSIPNWSATMKDTDGSAPDVSLPLFGNDDSANNNEYYATSIDFVNDGGSYDTIDWTFISTPYKNNGQCKLCGIVIVGEEAQNAKNMIFGK